MRIGLFTDVYPPFINGVSTSVLMLKKGLEELGHEVYVVTVNNESFSYKKEERVLRIPGVPTGIFDYRLTSIYPIRAIKTIKKWKLDVIHTHTEFGIGSFARLLSKQFNIPLVHTYHTMYEEYVHYITKGYFNSASKKLVEYLTLFLCDKTIDELIVPTKKAKELFKEKYKVKRDVHIIPSGVDTSRFHPENINKKEISKIRKDLGIKRSDFLVLYVGRIAQEKNIDFQINAFKKVIKKMPKARLLIVGDGPDMKDLIELTHNNKLDKNIIFAGRVPWEEVPKYYSLCDVFATSSTTETQGLTVIEAMGAAKPVIAIKDESFEEVMTNDKEGFFFETEKEYVEQLTKLYNDKNLRKRLSESGIKTAAKYSPLTYAKSVYKIYEKVIDKDTNILKKAVHKVKDVLKKGGKDEKDINMQSKDVFNKR